MSCYFNILHLLGLRHCALSEAEIDNVAGLLLDGTVFGIMGELRDIQEITENKQLKKRTAKQLDHKVSQFGNLLISLLNPHVLS